MEFRLLGPVEAEDEGQPLPLGGKQRRTLLSLLLLHAGKPVTTDQLVDELWGDNQPTAARKTVQAHVAYLRKVLNRDEEILAGVDDGYLLRVDASAIDSRRFEELIEEGRRLLHENPEAAVATFDDSLRLFRGTPLSGVADDGFTLRVEASRLEELRLGAVEARLQARLAVGHLTDVIAEAERLVSEHPLREGVWAVLMLALYRSGRQSEALRAFSRVRQVLAEELGIEPSGELRHLEQRILEQDPALEQEIALAPAMPQESALTVVRDPSLFGRDHEMSELLAALDSARSGHGSLFLIGGEPGIGKTRLADEIASRAREQGVTVLWGKGWEAGGAPAYWPWVQALRSYIRTADVGRIHDEMGAGAVDIAQMLPEVGAMFPDLSPPASIDPESARFRLFDSTATFLRNAATREPLLVVIDDLQAADFASILLLRFVAGQIGGMRLLLLATYRDVELAPDNPLTIPILELKREPATRHILLRGLSRTNVVRLIEFTSGVTPQTVLATALHRQTNGNPLFVAEAIRLLAAEGHLSAIPEVSALRAVIPEAVRDVIVRRLAHLTERCRLMLTTASVLGPEVTIEALRRLSDIDVDEFADVIDEAADASLLVEVVGVPGRLRFSHGLVREALYEEIPPRHRMRLHLAAGNTLEIMYEADMEPHLGEIAHHYFESASAGDASKAAEYAKRKAVEYAKRAAGHASRQLAYEDAVALYHMALQAAELQDGIEAIDRCDLLLGLGDAQARSGDLPGAQETFLAAYHLARRTGAERQVAQAALGYGGRFVWARAGKDPRMVPMLQDALVLLGGADEGVRVRLLSRLAGALRDAPDREYGASLSRQAVELARALGDAETLAYALEGHIFSIWWPENPQERLELATELVALATNTHDGERMAGGHITMSGALIELGLVREAKVEIDRVKLIAHEIRQPAQLWLGNAVHAVVLLLEGRFDEAEPLIEETLRAHQPTAVRDNVSAARFQMFLLRREQGRVEETESLIHDSVDEFLSYPLHRPALVCLHLDLGRDAEAREIFEELARDDFTLFHRDNEWLLGISIAAEACYLLKDVKAAVVLHEQLLPFRGRHSVGLAEGSVGAVDRYLGLLTGLLGRLDEAEQHFEDAITMNDRIGARPWAAHSRHDLAQLLLTRGGSGDHERATDLLDAALTAAREMGMATLITKIERTSRDRRTHR
jgi:DNA-binding SARP family transcriptional activator/tetratricopeptide (TPR) repeat protein